jgi:hypothetical protein
MKTSKIKKIEFSNLDNVSDFLVKEKPKRRFSFSIRSNHSDHSQKKNNNFKIKINLSRSKKIFLAFFTILFVIVLILSINLFNITYNSYKLVTNNLDYVKQVSFNLLRDIDAKNIDNIDNYFHVIQSSFDNIDVEIGKYEFVKDIEILKAYYQNFTIARQILQKVDQILSKVLPNLKIVLHVSGFVSEDQTLVDDNISSDNGTQLILKNLSEYISLYKLIEPDIYEIFDLFKKIDRNYIPEVQNFDLAQIFQKADDLIQIYPEVSKNLLDFISYLPELIGSNKQTSYLLIMQNETEMRASGGLITSFGIITLENGKIMGDIKLKDTWTLENYVSYTLGQDVGYRNFGAQNHLMMGSNYLRSWSCGSSYTRAQDSGQYHDLYISSMMFKDYYDIASKSNPSEYPRYDHIITINYAFSENMLELIQPIYVEPWGLVDAEILYEFIKNETDNIAKYGAFGADRKQIISDIADVIKDKIFHIPPDEIPTVISLLIKSITAKDISFSTKDPDMQAFFDKYGLTARVPKNISYDYFHFSEGQNCSLKLNKWMRNNVIQNISISDNGTISKTVDINWINEKVFEPQLFSQYDNSLQFSYRAWARFMFPKNSSAISSNGFKQSGYTLFNPEIYVDRKIDKQVIDAAIQFDHRRLTAEAPPARHSLKASWTLDESYNYLRNGEVYKMLIQKHPGKSWGEMHQVNINYLNETFSTNFVLDQDKVLTFRDGIIFLENYHTQLDWIKDLLIKI